MAPARVYSKPRKVDGRRCNSLIAKSSPSGLIVPTRSDNFCVLAKPDAADAADGRPSPAAVKRRAKQKAAYLADH